MANDPLTLYENRHFTRFLFPFSLNSVICDDRKKGLFKFSRKPQKSFFNDLVQAISNSESWHLPPTKKGKKHPKRMEYLLPHVNEFLFPDNDLPADRRYVFTYQLDNSMLQKLFRSRGNCQLIVPRSREICENKNAQDYFVFPFEVESIQLTLFRSGVGMLAFHVTMNEGILKIEVNDKLSKNIIDEIISGIIDKKGKEEIGDAPISVKKLSLDLEQMILFNRWFRSLTRNNNSTYLRRPEGSLLVSIADHNKINNNSEKTEAVAHRTTISDVIDFLLLPLGKKGESWETFYQRRLIGYCYALIKHPQNDNEDVDAPIDYDNDLAISLYRLRRYFDSAYKPTKYDLHLTENPEILQTFENIYHGMSLEGCAVLAIDTGVPYIRNNLHSKVKNGYYAVYLLALHQRLATIHLARQIGRLCFLRHAYRRGYNAIPPQFKDIRTQIFEFIVQCWFAEVSNMKMYTGVYKRWQHILEVGPLLQEVKSEVEELDDYLQRIKMDRENKLINTLTWFFMPIAIISGIFGMNFVELAHQEFSTWFLVLVLSWLVWLLGILYYQKRK